MSETTTAVIEKVTSKEGATNGKPWLKFGAKVEGVWYSTFDAAIGAQAQALEGDRAEITWKASGSEGQFRDLLGVKAVTGYQAAEIPQARTDNGSPDWDEIGLRKTRCVLWGDFLGSPLAALIANEPGEKPTANRVFDFGQALIAFAEGDIYRRPIAKPDEDLPF